VVLMRVKINRRRVAPTDGLVDVELNGVCYSAAEATNVLICSRNPNIRRFPHYTWNSEGIFRSFSGPFKWHFQLKTDSETNYLPRTIETRFGISIDFEHDTIDDILTTLRYRLELIRNSLEHYDATRDFQGNLLKAFEPIIEGDL
jgi:hypothetical protein